MQDLFDLNQQHLVGKLIFAPKGNCAIGQLSVPLAKDVLVLSAADLKHQDMKILSDFYPVLAGNIVKYDGQPILAVFGPNFESVELYSRQITVEYLPIDTVSASSTVRQLKKQLGKDYNSIEGEEFVSTLTANQHDQSTISGQRVHAVFENGKMHIKCVSQWPMHVKQQVARELGMNESDVLVYPQECFSPNDQLVYQPTVTSILASIAALKTGKLVELSVPMTSTQPQLECRFCTKVNSDGIPIAHKAVVTADLGSHPIFATEYCNALFAGLIPVYPMESVDIDVSVLTSGNKPACFFNDLGYGVASAATEMHISKLARKLEKNPALFREAMFNGQSSFSMNLRRLVVSSANPDKLSQTMKACQTDSGFDRLYAVNNQKGLKRSSFYLRGIGISCGEGTQGFSTRFPYLKDYSISLTIDREKNVTINQSLHVAESNLELWRAIVTKELGVEPGKITFSTINDPGVVDNGPSVLSRSNSFMATLIERACLELKTKTVQEYPATATVAFEETQPQLFSSYCNGTVVVSLHVDYVTQMPVVDVVTVRLVFGKVLSPTKLKSHLRHIIINTIAEICPEVNQNFSIDLKLASDQTKPVGSADSLIRGLTGASFMSALNQAVGRDFSSMPITQKEMFALPAEKEEKDENQSYN